LGNTVAWLHVGWFALIRSTTFKNDEHV
jgi:hypothetical protein